MDSESSDDEIIPVLQMSGYSLVFARKGSLWHLWKYYTREYESQRITLNVHIFYSQYTAVHTIRVRKDL